MATRGVGLLIEACRHEIVTAWRQAVEQECGAREPALAFVVQPLLRELALALSSGGADPLRSSEAWKRCAVLVRSTAVAAEVVREVKLLRRCGWEVLQQRGVLTSPHERRILDEWLDDALAEALDRLERLRFRAVALEQGAMGGGLTPRLRPPPLPSVRGSPRIAPPFRDGARKGFDPSEAANDLL